MIQHPPLQYPFVFKQAADDAFCAYVRSLILSKREQFEENTQGPSRRFFKMDYVSPEGDRILFAAKERLAAHYGIGDYVVPPI